MSADNLEREFLKVLGNSFTHYVGKEEGQIEKTEFERRGGVPKRIIKYEQAEARRRKEEERRKEALENLRNKKYVKGKYSFDRVAAMVCAMYGLKREQLVSVDRTPVLVSARRAVILFLRDRRGLTLKEIGRLLGYRDHSTVLHHYKQAKQNPEPQYEELAQRIEEYQN